MNGWREIERDKNGFATKRCLDEMFNSLPILIYADSEYDHYSVVEYCNASDYRGDIELHTQYIKWKPIINP